jgi:hypothetical protein
MIYALNKKKVFATSLTSTQSLSLEEKQVDEIVEEYRDIFSSPIGVPMHCQVKHQIYLTLGAPLPNGPVYRRSLMEKMMKSSARYKRFFKRGTSEPAPPLVEILIVLVQKKDGIWRLFIDYIALKKITVKNRYPIP